MVAGAGAEARDSGEADPQGSTRHWSGVGGTGHLLEQVGGRRGDDVRCRAVGGRRGEDGVGGENSEGLPGRRLGSRPLGRRRLSDESRRRRLHHC